MRRHPLLVLPLAGALLAGCGSTVQVAGGVPIAGGATPGLSAPGDGLSLPSSAPGAVPGAPGSTPATDGTLPEFVTPGGPVADGSGGQTGGTAGPSGTGAGRVPVAAGPSGPGVTAKEIYIGLVYQVNGEALNSAAGAGGITTGDGKRNYEIVIDDINKRGGIAGRKLVPVFAEFDATSTQTVDQQWAAICEKFTRDEPRVFAVDGAGRDSYRACIHKAGVSMLNAGLPTVRASTFQRYPGFIEIGYPNLDRLAAYHVQPLVAQRYFTPWNARTGEPAPAGTPVKVGILTYDDSEFGGAVDQHLIPALRRLGHQPEVAKISQVSTASDYGEQAAAVQSAALSFASRGVTHVIPFEANAGLSLFFLNYTRSQNYYPRFGINSASGFQVLSDIGAADERQLRGTVGYGWLPGLDLRAADNPDNGPYSSESRRYCLKVFREAGVSYGDANAAAVALSACATLYLLDVALDRTPSQVTRETFVRSAESLGSSYVPAGSLGQTLRPGRHDPADKAYYWRHFEDCGCFRYSGRIQTVP